MLVIERVIRFRLQALHAAFDLVPGADSGIAIRPPVAGKGWQTTGMRRVALLRLVAAVLTILIAALALFSLYELWRSPDRTDLSTFLVVPISIIGIIPVLISVLRRLHVIPERDMVDTAELDQLADMLAEEVRGRWNALIREGGLATPIPVQWKRSSLPLAGPVSAAVGSRVFPPVPGLASTGQQQLDAGSLDDLLTVFGGLGSGRLMITGARGSGKTGAGAILVQDLLKHRQVSELDRSRIPVPVLLALEGWGPGQDIVRWLSAQITQTYLPLSGKKSAAVMARLLETDRVAVILDGFDALAVNLRQAALQELNRQAVFRLVVLCGDKEMAAAARHCHLADSVALELQKVDHETAADYLASAQVDPPPDGWGRLVTRLRAESSGPLAAALDNPDSLNLVRDISDNPEAVREFLRFCDVDSHDIPPEAMEDYLLARVLSAFYELIPGKAWKGDKQPVALRTLSRIAAQMNKEHTRDLEWWHISEWTPHAPRLLVTTLAAGLVTSLISGIEFGFMAGVKYGFALGVVLGLVAVRRRQFPRRMASFRWRSAFKGIRVAPARRLGCVGGLATGLLIGATFFSVFVIEFGADYLWALVMGFDFGFLFGFAAWFAVGLLYAFIYGLVSGFSQFGPTAISPLSPLASRRSDQVASLLTGVAGGVGFGLVSGIAAWLARGLFTWISSGHTPDFRHMVLVGTGFGLAGGVAYGLVSSQSWSASIAAVQLASRWGTPHRMMRFLEAARESQIVYAVGPIYQFRSDRLQDRLASQSTIPAYDASGSRRIRHTGSHRLADRNQDAADSMTVKRRF
jgi:hypothetical protein